MLDIIEGNWRTNNRSFVSCLAVGLESDPLDPLGDMLAEQRREKSSI